MENPRVRWIEAHPFVQDGQELILLRDMEGITEQALAVSRKIAYMISLMDGTRTVRDIQIDFMRTAGELVYIEKIQELVDTLDTHLFLLNDNYRCRFEKMKGDYEKSPVRKAHLAGRSYPANRMDLLSFLDESLGTGKDQGIDGEITGLIAPHIDYARGMSVYGQTYPYLKHFQKPLIVIFGTCHHPTDGILSISLKDFETPLEVIPHAKELGRLIRDDNVLKRYIDEWPHRGEHSIELQLPLIQFMVQHDYEILPILTGSMHEYIAGDKNISNGQIDEITSSLKQVLESHGKPFIVLSGADLAHIGEQFGDPPPLDETTLARSRSQDKIILQSVENVDAEGFFNAIKEERDERRICGLTPIFFQLKLLHGSHCKIVGYDQWYDGKSSVSFAGGIFYT